MKSGEKPCTGAGPCIFISYSHKDSARVSPVLDAMRARGYRICYDAMIPAGEPWTKFLAEHISDCAVFLPFLSAAFLASGQCLKEVRFMDSKKKLTVPVWLETPDRNGVPAEVEFLLNKAQELRLGDFPDAAAFAEHLLREPNFQPCRDTPADTVAELVTNERPVSASASFVGRADILRDIEAAFRDGETIVNLYGMGGIGKSEICRKLYHDRADALSRYVGWLTWHDTLQNTLYAQFRDIREDNAARYLQLAREYVRDKGRELL
ncbi:MAG: toll/interleukin-1 receptor domain-containing protein, partial [Oscillibacter sp.]|nr:toll/interleukin-1 receptor domain-containing protein [Oscillibacter sp.]